MKFLSHRRARLAALLPGLIGLAVAAQEPPPLGSDLAALLDHARRVSPDYAVMRAEADAATERIGPAGALADPRLRAELMDITRQDTQAPLLLPGQVGSTRYLLMQELPWAGKRALRRDIASDEADAARERARQTWADIAGRIKSLQARRLYLERSVALNRQDLDLLGRLEQIARARYAGGLSAQQDAIRAQTEQTALRTDLIAQQAERSQLRAQLNALLARPAQAALAEPAGARALPPPRQLDAAALARRLQERSPWLAGEAARLRAARQGRELSYRNRYPDLTLGLAPVQYQGAVREWGLMLEFNIPLQQETRRAQERESEAMLAAAQARRQAAAQQAQAELDEQLTALEAARDSEQQVRQALLPQAELSYRAALAGYETGKVDFATVLDAQRQIRRARQSQIKSELEAQLRLSDIERLIGEDL